MSHPARKIIQKPFRGSLVNSIHPLAKDLLGCWIFNELTGNRIFDCSGNNNDLTLFPDGGSTGGWRSLDGGTIRLDALGSSSGDYLESTTNNRIYDNTFSNGMTLYVRGRGVGESVSLCGIVSGATVPFELMIDNGDRLLFRLWSSGGANIDVIPTGLTTDLSRFYSYFCVYKPGVEMQLYRDEVLLGSRTTSIPTSLRVLASPKTFWFGTRANSGSPTNPLSSFNYDGWFSTITLWERALSDTERIQVLYNPYQVF